MSNDKHQTLRDALNKAFRFGQEYGSQADSESYSENRRSYETQAKFEAMREDTIRALLADHDRVQAALKECEKLLRRTPKINRDIYTGADRESWGIQARAVLKTVRDTLKEGKQ